MPRTSEPGRSVTSRLVDIMFAFTAKRRELSLADLARLTGLPHPTVRRLALELVEAGVLNRDQRGLFTVGLRLWQLATLAPHTESLRAVANPFMEDLFMATQQHVQLAVLEGEEAVVIDRRSAPRAPGLVSRVGGRLPLHASAVGKVLLAHQSDAFIEHVLERRLPRYTAKTIADADKLRQELVQCRKLGVMTVEGELTPEVDSAAARIVGADGRVVGALSVIVHQDRVRLQSIQPSVHACGLGISRLLGWRPETQLRRG